MKYNILYLSGLVAACIHLPTLAQTIDQDGALAIRQPNAVSPVRAINQPFLRDNPLPELPPLTDQFRQFDGRGNNLADVEMGGAVTKLARWCPADYSDNLATLAGEDRKSPREISNLVSAQSESIENPLNATDFLWQWGQFLDHDLSLTDGVDPAEPEPIQIPDDDQYFTPGTTIAFNRSIYDSATGTTNPRQQLNEITAWIDASNVYGSDSERALALRTLDGTGRLLTSDGNLLPFNTEGLPNAGGDSPELFLAGDIRANEQVGLTAMHTLFVREHNRLVAQLTEEHPDWDGEQLYQKARQLVGAQMQIITYREFLPTLLGPNALAPYQCYRPETNARIANLFSTAAYRFGHSALSPTLLRLNAQNTPIPAGHLALRDAFFSPQHIREEGGIAPILRGLAQQRCQRIDPYLIDDVRNFLFGDPSAGGFDLAALNIQRGRDHGLPDYNQARIQLGLTPITNFQQLTRDPELQERLTAAYTDIDQVDLWVGGLAETPKPGAHLGEFLFTVLKGQFEALRDGDRFWYALTLTPEERQQLEQTRLADIIRRNTAIGDELQANVFRLPPL